MQNSNACGGVGRFCGSPRGDTLRRPRRVPSLYWFPAVTNAPTARDGSTELVIARDGIGALGRPGGRTGQRPRRDKDEGARPHHCTGSAMCGRCRVASADKTDRCARGQADAPPRVNVHSATGELAEDDGEFSSVVWQ